MDSATPYGNEFAGLYDLFHAAKPYRSEARFIRDMGRSAGRRLLDVACGTGTHAIELSKFGFEVTAVDVSAAMLREARKKAKMARRAIRFILQDLTELTVPGEFDVATCLFDSLGYLRSDARIARALRRVNGALRPGGLLIAEVWHAQAMLAGFDPLRVRRVRGRGVEAVRIGETQLLPHNLAEVRYEVFVRRGESRTWRRFTETHVNRFFTRSEIVALLTDAGFRIKSVLGGFEGNAATEDAWHLVLVAESDR